MRMLKRLPRRGERGFTLVELLIVLAILAVLAAVVIPNVTGMFGRGAQQAYETDVKTIQTALSTFYFDVHSWDSAADKGWNEAVGVSTNGHYYPTASAQPSSLRVSTTKATYNKQTVYKVLLSGGGDAQTADITAASIWMGLLVNSPGSGPSVTAADVAPGTILSPLLTEKGPYLNEIPKSCSGGNSALGSGTYTWIVGQDGKVYGVTYITPDAPATVGWYSGFNSTYP